MLHRHSYIPYKIAKYRKSHLGRITPRRKAHYKAEVRRVIRANRTFIDSYLRNSIGKFRRRETMDLLYAVRAHALNRHTLDYVTCIASEMNDLDGKFGSRRLRLK